MLQASPFILGTKFNWPLNNFKKHWDGAMEALLGALDVTPATLARPSPHLLGTRKAWHDYEASSHARHSGMTRSHAPEYQEILAWLLVPSSHAIHSSMTRSYAPEYQEHLVWLLASSSHTIHSGVTRSLPLNIHYLLMWLPHKFKCFCCFMWIPLALLGRITP
jgi:hypothetical protein